MNTERDVTRIVRSWLRTEEYESADRVLANVLAQLDTTPRRRSWRPARRFADMNTFARLAIAAAAVVVVAVAGINLLPARGGIGGTSPGPTVSPSPSPRVFPAPGGLAVGRHALTLNGVTFTLELTTSGWTSEGTFGIDKGPRTAPGAAGFIFWDNAPDGVFSDPCTEKRAPPAGPSAARLAAALTTIPGTRVVSGPSDVKVDGRPAKHVVIAVPGDIGCTPEKFYLWYHGDGPYARYATEANSTINVWIIDVNGKLVWIDGETYKGSGPDAAREIQRIIDSIRFE